MAQAFRQWTFCPSEEVDAKLLKIRRSVFGRGVDFLTRLHARSGQRPPNLGGQSTTSSDPAGWERLRTLGNLRFRAITIKGGSQFARNLRCLAAFDLMALEHEHKLAIPQQSH